MVTVGVLSGAPTAQQPAVKVSISGDLLASERSLALCMGKPPIRVIVGPRLLSGSGLKDAE